MTARPASGKYYRFDSISVLVADDNRFVRQILVTVLKGLGVGKVMQAECGEEAQAIIDIQAQMEIDGKALDMVFADHLMRPGDGLDLLQWCRAHDRDSVRFMPFVMMSGEADVRAVTDARAFGVTEYLAKPMSVTGVASRLLAIIDRPRPFVRAPGYFGPDRRRQTLPFDGGERRMMTTNDIRVFDETATTDDDLPPPDMPLEEASHGR
jgi:CheY-like chemotaxis protein